jgi:hypothetical protein
MRSLGPTVSKPFRAKDDFRIRSSLAGFQPKPTDSYEIKKAGWQELGILVVDVNHGSLTPAQRAFIENIGTMYYGKRKETKPKPQRTEF